MVNHIVQLEFLGFDPDYEVHSSISSVADRIHSLAPSDSLVKVAMTKGKDSVQASCRIASQAGTFVAEAVCRCPKAAIQQIEQIIRSQLDEWKRHRFADKRIDAKSWTKFSRPKLEIAI